jgi:intergrase/recombinase
MPVLSHLRLSEVVPVLTDVGLDQAHCNNIVFFKSYFIIPYCHNFVNPGVFYLFYPQWFLRYLDRVT